MCCMPESGPQGEHPGLTTHADTVVDKCNESNALSLGRGRRGAEVRPPSQLESHHAFAHDRDGADALFVKALQE